MGTITTATATVAVEGPLTKAVRNFTNAQGAAMARGIKTEADWEPVAAFIDAGSFKRVGAYLEELDWEAYKGFLTGWAAGGTKFEFDELHVTEAGDAVFQEIIEHHHRDDQYIRKNVIAVYRFTPEGKIRHLDIYEQAKDSGDWIKDAARKVDMGAE
ncbi:MAG: hypothetical protein KDE55_17425 [Novosphingobium sp.]|nr:hypothetical protein [Novosphingobium sp.]